MKLAALGSIGLCIFTQITIADSLKKSFVAADAQWLAHVDVEAALRSKLATIALAEVTLDELKQESGVGALEDRLGLDLARDVKSVTAYGNDATSDNPMVLVHTTTAIDQAMTRLATLEGHKVELVEGYAIHSFEGTNDPLDGGSFCLFAAQDTRVLVLAKEHQRVLHGMRVLEGRDPNLATAENSPLKASPSPGSIAFVAVACGLSEFADIEAASTVVRLTRTVVFDLSENRGELFATLQLGTDSVDSALKVAQVVQGVTALASLAIDGQPGAESARDLIAAVRVETRGTSVTIEFRYDVQRLIDDLKALESMGD